MGQYGERWVFSVEAGEMGGGSVGGGVRATTKTYRCPFTSLCTRQLSFPPLTQRCVYVCAALTVNLSIQM